MGRTRVKIGSMGASLDATTDELDETAMLRGAADELESWPRRVADAPTNEHPRHLGRYEVRGELGRGGMGVVYRARDPDLGRDVALKILRLDQRSLDERSRGVARLVREAQAMAQLSHPNVISVFDVGTFDDPAALLFGAPGVQVFVAMELVEGKTLREWLRDPSHDWPARLDVCRRAGQGLLAAHRASLVHRDFKPSNVLIGDDGRVRVMDFGLASSPLSMDGTVDTPFRSTLDGVKLDERLTVTGAVVGTPAYMAPELFIGTPPDERSDQFAFGATLYEALFGVRAFAGRSFKELRLAIVAGRISSPGGGHGVPAWLRRVVRRGLAPKPEDRFGSMEAMLRALSGPPKTRSRALALGGVVGVAGLLGLAALSTDDKAQCDASAKQALDPWNEEIRDALKTALWAAPDGVPEAVVERVDHWHDDWSRVYDETCAAVATMPPARFDQASACLRSHATEVRELIAAVSDPEDEVIANAARAVEDLPDARRCLKQSNSAPSQPPQAREIDELLASARALERTGRYDRGHALAEEALSRAESLDHEPTTLRALVRVGALRSLAGDPAEAEVAYERAVWLAREIGDDRRAASAATSLINIVGMQLGRPEDGHEWARHAEATLARLDDVEEEQARLLMNLGLILDDENRLDEARSAYLRALDIYERHRGADSLDVSHALNNLGTLEFSLGRYDVAEDLGQRSLRIKEARLGPDHPDVAKTLNNLGIAVHRQGRYEDARDLHQRALDIRERSLAADHPLTATSLNNLGLAAHELRDLDAARGYHERALEIREKVLGPDHPKTGSSLTNLASVYLELDRYEDARSYLRRAADLDERTVGAEHPLYARSLYNLAVLDQNNGEHSRAEKLARQSLDIMRTSLGAEHFDVARTYDLLANTVGSQDRDAEAVELYSQALRTFDKTVGGDHPNAIDARQARGWAYLATEDVAAAREDFERAIADVERAEAVPTWVAGSSKWGLAKALRASGVEQERGLALAAAAIVDYGDNEHAKRTIESWLESASASWAEPM